MESFVERQCSRWGLRPIGAAIETRTSITQKVAYATGVAALKCFKPGFDQGTAAGALAWFGGEGSVRLLLHDRDALLMEWVDGAPLSDLVRDGRDDHATRILADVVHKLHAPRPEPILPAEPLERRMAPILEGRPAADALTREAGALARRLLNSTKADRPLHGDLHHDNVLHHRERGWLAIDPKSVVGDPHYELANPLCNPVRYPEIVRKPDRAAVRAKIFAERLGLEVDRLLSFALCHACLAAVWCTQDGEDPRHWQEMARIIRELRSRER